MPLEEKYRNLIRFAIPQAEKEETLLKLSALYDCVVSTNERINITSLVSPIDVTLKHLIDSLTLLQAPVFGNFSPRKRICDIGCGGGFPGLPLATVLSDHEITMIDSTEKKITALKENAALLGLERVVPLWGRGEELAGARGAHRGRYDLCVSRAVARLPVLTELCLPFVKTGGRFVAMKGQKAYEELKESRRAIEKSGGALAEVIEVKTDFHDFPLEAFSEEEKEKIRDYALSARYLIVIVKKKETPAQLPRKWAEITKKPL